MMNSCGFLLAGREATRHRRQGYVGAGLEGCVERTGRAEYLCGALCAGGHGHTGWEGRGDRLAVIVIGNGFAVQADRFARTASESNSLFRLAFDLHIGDFVCGLRLFRPFGFF
jgi:hypothetical protein